ncbi:ankyrin repeat domain-containing protein [Desulfonauticus submarinus]
MTHKKNLLFFFISIFILLLSNCLKTYAQNTNSLNEKLMTAVYFDNAKEAENLIKQGAQVNFWDPDSGNTPLTHAAEGLSFNAIKILIKYGANINIQEKMSGMTALYLLALCGNDPKAIQIAEWLLQHNADPNIKNDGDETPLEIAACNGYLDFVKLLVKYGAKINIKNEFTGVSPLSCAKKNGHDDIVKFLKAHGAHF